MTKSVILKSGGDISEVCFNLSSVTLTKRRLKSSSLIVWWYRSISFGPSCPCYTWMYVSSSGCQLAPQSCPPVVTRHGNGRLILHAQQTTVHALVHVRVRVPFIRQKVLWQKAWLNQCKMKLIKWCWWKKYRSELVERAEKNARSSTPSPWLPTTVNIKKMPYCHQWRPDKTQNTDK